MAILHPNIYYFILDASWSAVNSLEYWNKGNTATTVNNNTVHKTIYSPSPSSFSEPKTAAFTGFTSSGGNQTSGFNVNGGFNKGWNFYCQPNATGGTIYFSALGFRDVVSAHTNTSNAGSLSSVGVIGLYWSAGTSDTPKAYGMSYSSGDVYAQSLLYGGLGSLVRSTFE